MTLLIVLGCVIAFVAAYLAVGWQIAILDMPDSWEYARETWGSLPNVAAWEVRQDAIRMTCFWLFILPARLVVGHFDDAIERNDPKARELELKHREQAVAEREKTIAKLERELGIGRIA